MTLLFGWDKNGKAAREAAARPVGRRLVQTSSTNGRRGGPTGRDYPHTTSTFGPYTRLNHSSSCISLSLHDFGQVLGISSLFFGGSILPSFRNRELILADCTFLPSSVPVRS